VELADQFPIRRISPIAAPLPKADDAAVARVEPGGALMPASRRLLVMNPLKVSRVTNESGQRALKKRQLCRMSRVSLSSMRARLIATGHRELSSLYDLRQMGWPMRLALSV
jgi:hypothetical protein